MGKEIQKLIKDSRQTAEKIHSEDFRREAADCMQRYFLLMRIYLYASIVLWLWIFLH